MATTLSGPLFDPSEDEDRKSIIGKGGGHYNIYATKTPERAMAMLRAWFPDGEANEFNFVLFSTSGIHGSYSTIEDEFDRLGKPDEDSDEVPPPLVTQGEVTFLLVQPRIVGMTYGNVAIRNAEDAEFLKKLRASSWKVASVIGKPEES